MAAAKTLTKEQRVERARRAALARTTPESALRTLESRSDELSEDQIGRLYKLALSKIG